MPAPSKAAAKASGGAKASALASGSRAPTGGADEVRAEFPPTHYWRGWCADAAAAQFPAANADSAQPVEPPLPQVLPTGEDADAPYRILIVEDDPSQALFAESVLVGTGMQAHVVTVGSEVMAAMDAFRPDLVLTDLHMPGLNGAEITALIRADAAFAHVPIVFLTGDVDPERQFEVLQVGADDFLTKPVRPRHLVAAVESRVRRARAFNRQREVAGRHPVSGLHTRAAMLRELGEAVPGAHNGAVAFVEIEHVTALRDRFGYAALDAGLIEAGRRLAQVASGCSVCRLNDNTFVVHAPRMDAAPLDAAPLETWARTLRDGLGRQPLEINGENVRLHAIVGYAALQLGFDDASAALVAAEQALRAARTASTGIAAYQAQAVQDPGSDTDAAILLHDALDNDRFELAYQPIVAVAGGDEAQFQTLLRLRDAEGSLHTAAEILPVAQKLGVMERIDRHVLELAVATLHRRSGENRPVRLFVTQAARSLAADGYAQWLLQSLDATDITGSALVVDVRQDEALIHVVALKEFCKAMMTAGVQLCLSQYSAGSETNALLSQLPLGYVRLAARYSSKLDDNAVRDEMRAAIERAHRLGLQVIGQQVEDPQAAATLWMSGVDYIQGNLVQQAADRLDFNFHHSVL